MAPRLVARFAARRGSPRRGGSRAAISLALFLALALASPALASGAGAGAAGDAGDAASSDDADAALLEALDAEAAPFEARLGALERALYGGDARRRDVPAAFRDAFAFVASAPTLARAKETNAAARREARRRAAERAFPARPGVDAPERVAAAERARTALAEATRPILRAFDAPRAKTTPTSTAAEDRSRIIRGGEDSAEPSSDASDSDDLDEYLDREFVAGVDAGTPVALETARDGSVSVRFHFEDAPASSSTRAAEILAAVAAADAGLGHSAAANEKDKDKDKDKDAARENTNTPVRDAAAALKRALDAAKAYAKLEDPDAAAAEAEEEASASSPLTAADLVPAHWPAVSDALFLLAALVDAGLVPPRGFPPRGDARALVGTPPLAEDDSESRGGAFGASNKAAPESEPEPESEFEFEFASPRVLERGAGEPAWAASPRSPRRRRPSPGCRATRAARIPSRTPRAPGPGGGRAPRSRWPRRWGRSTRASRWATARYAGEEREREGV